MKILKISKLTFISYFMFSFIPMIVFLTIYLYVLFHRGIHLTDLIVLAVILMFSYYLYFIINYYLFDKDTIIEIDMNGNVTYSNMEQKHFHLEDIDFCTKLGPSRLYIGMTEITLKDGSRIDVSNFISLEYIYKMNPNIKIERFGYYRAIILRREKL